MHGPLQATWLMEAFIRSNPKAKVNNFTYRAIRPLFDSTKMTGIWKKINKHKNKFSQTQKIKKQFKYNPKSENNKHMFGLKMIKSLLQWREKFLSQTIKPRFFLKFLYFN